MKRMRVLSISVILCAFILSFFPASRIAGADPSNIWLNSTDSASGDYFGRSLSLSGDTLLVGAYGSYAGGSAYVFVYDGSSWVEQAKLISDDRVPDDSFGYCVCLDGDTAVIGAYTSNQATGAAYIFGRDVAGYWKQQAKLVPEDGQKGERFGFDVAISGNSVLVADYVDENGNGSIYFFERDGLSWQYQGKQSSPEGVGYSVSINGDVALAGAFRENSGAGAAYLYTRNGKEWVEKAKLIASDGKPGDWFGAEVSLYGNTAVIGAYRANNAAGAAYVFESTTSGWVETVKLQAPDPKPDDFFGYALGLNSDRVMVGSYHYYNYAGTAYLFERNESGWNYIEEMGSIGELLPADWFGFSIAVGRGCIAIGAPKKQGRGLVYLDFNPGEVGTALVPVEISPAGSIGTNAAELHGSLNSMGNAYNVVAYFEYGIADYLSHQSFSYTDRTEYTIMNETGSFSASLKRLRPGTVYNFRAVVDAGEYGISYSPNMSFTTVAIPGSAVIPTVESEIEPLSPYYIWWSNNLKIVIPAFVVVVIIGIIVSKHREDRARVLLARAAMTHKSRKSNYEAVINEMATLVQLRKQGTLSEEEYQVKKKALIESVQQLN